MTEVILLGIFLLLSLLSFEDYKSKETPDYLNLPFGILLLLLFFLNSFSFFLISLGIYCIIFISNTFKLNEKLIGLIDVPLILFFFYILGEYSSIIGIWEVILGFILGSIGIILYRKRQKAYFSAYGIQTEKEYENYYSKLYKLKFDKGAKKYNKNLLKDKKKEVPLYLVLFPFLGLILGKVLFFL